MKKRMVFPSLAVLLVAAAPALPQSKNIHEIVDPYTGLRSLFLEVSTRTCPGDPARGERDPEVHLLFGAMQNTDGTVSYTITPELDAAGYALSLRSGDTMDTLTDGQPGGLITSAGSITTQQYDGGHSFRHETVPFDVTTEQLNRLTTAKTFQFRVNGQRQDVQRCTDAKHLRDLAEFLGVAATYGPETGSVAPGPLTEEVSSSTKLRTLTLSGIATTSCPGDAGAGPGNYEVRLEVSANQRSDGSVWYFLIADLSNGPVLNLQRGARLQTQMEGKSSAFNTINGSKLRFELDAAGRSVQHERIAFHVHQPDLIALSASTMLEFRLQGQNGSVRRCAYADQFKQLNEFIQAAAHYEPATVASR